MKKDGDFNDEDDTVKCKIHMGHDNLYAYFCETGQINVVIAGWRQSMRFDQAVFRFSKTWHGGTITIIISIRFPIPVF